MKIIEKLTRIINRGYSIECSYPNANHHQIIATKGNDKIQGSVYQVHKKLFGY